MGTSPIDNDTVSTILFIYFGLLGYKITMQCLIKFLLDSFEKNSLELVKSRPVKVYFTSLVVIVDHC